MSAHWTTSWTWRQRCPGAEPPSAPQPTPPGVADALGGLLSRALDAALGHGSTRYLALAHAALTSEVEPSRGIRIDYRVAPRVRFPEGGAPRGAAALACSHVADLGASGRLSPTRGPSVLGDVLAQQGLALLTLRRDLLDPTAPTRIGTYLLLAASREVATPEVVEVIVHDVASGECVCVPGRALATAWHAPLAGGEILMVLPPFAMPTRRAAGLLSGEREGDSGVRSAPASSGARGPRRASSGSDR